MHLPGQSHSHGFPQQRGANGRASPYEARLVLPCRAWPHLMDHDLKLMRLAMLITWTQ